MEPASHLGFIVAAYGAAVVIIGLLIAWVMIDLRMQRRKLAALEMRGVARRSSVSRPERPMAEAKEKA